MLGVGGSIGGEESRTPGSTSNIGGEINETGQGDGGDDERGGGLRSGGNRWPRQETLALLKVRSDMDAAFRDSTPKGPLWEEVARKLAELGYNRSAKKCKEKFENVYKYHKRTRDQGGPISGKQDGKTYRFSDHLEAFDNHRPIASPTPPKNPNMAPPLSMLNHSAPNTSTLPLTNPSNLVPSNPTSSSTFSDEELRGGVGDGRRSMRKRKWKGFFERLVKEVMEKQEELHNKFLDAVEKSENERSAREESRRMDEMARMDREREILAHERSMAASKDAALVAFLQKIAETNAKYNFSTGPVITDQAHVQPESLHISAGKEADNAKNTPIPAPPPSPPARKLDNGESLALTPASSSRWPEIEVQALINIRTNLDSKYLDNGPKGPLWEDISAQMKKLGYDRSAKRCKEKWENINKYFKKVKESNKKRREASKTCPYFEQLDAIYREKSRKITDMAPLMVTPEQQWPPRQDRNPDNDEDGTEYGVVAGSKSSSNGDNL